MQKRIGLLWMMVLSTLAAAAWAADPGIVVENAWVNEAPPGAEALAGYMTVENQSRQVRTLVGATSPAFGMVMLHRSIVEGGMAKMVHQHAIEIAPGGDVVFEPGSYHLMLMNPKHPLKSGDKMEVVLKFKDGAALPVTFEVRRGADMNMGHGMEHGH
jgi:copper(I)-binding protein